MTQENEPPAEEESSPEKAPKKEPTPIQRLAETVREPEGPAELVQAALLAAQFGPAAHPLANKITDKHITAMLDNDRRQHDNLLVDRNDARRKSVWILVIACVFVLILVGMLLWKDRDVSDILTTLVVFVSATLGGIGISKQWL